jgi:hypothetical protein
MKTTTTLERLRGAPRLHGVESLVEIFVGLTAISGGLALAFDPDGSSTGLTTSLLQGSGFSSYLVPGLLLAFVVGGLNVAAATLTIRRSPAASIVSLAAGAALLLFISAEVLLTHVRSPFQLAMFAVGAAIVLLSAPPSAPHRAK